MANSIPIAEVLLAIQPLPCFNLPARQLYLNVLANLDSRLCALEDERQPAPAGIVFRIRWQQLGGHIQCRLFQAKSHEGTWSKNGELVFDETGWAAIRPRLTMLGVEIVAEEI